MSDDPRSAIHGHFRHTWRGQILLWLGLSWFMSGISFEARHPVLPFMPLLACSPCWGRYSTAPSWRPSAPPTTRSSRLKMPPGAPSCSRRWSAALPKEPQEWPVRAWWPWSRPIYRAVLPGRCRTHAGQGLDLFRSGPVNCDEPTCGHAPRSHACSAAAVRFRMVSTSGVRARYRASDSVRASKA